MKRGMDQSMHRKKRASRGVALILVLTAVAIFTAVVVDFAYSERIDLDLAANARDEVRAYFLARSAVNLSRLVLHFQRQLDNMKNALPPGLQIPGMSAAGAPGMPPMGGALPNIRLYDLIPVDSGMLQMLRSNGGSGSPDDLDQPLVDSDQAPAASDEPPEPGQDLSAAGGKGKVASFGDFSGSFHADIDDEESKFNLARLDNLGRVMQVAISQALLMFGDKRYEWLYDQDDANGARASAKDLVINIHDFIDADQMASALNPMDPVNPFVPGSSDEASAYTRYTPSYKPKNASFDSLDELYQVDGVSDDFMAAFRDRLTVYPDKNRAIDINTDDPFMQVMNIFMAAQNPSDPMLQNPLLIQEVLRDLQLAKLFAGMGITVPQFVGILQANKIAVDPGLLANIPGNIRLSDHSETFSIHAVGEVGKVQKKLTAVIRSDDGLGQLVYWREE